MPYTITIFPKFKGSGKVNAIRKKFDPGYSTLKPHITLVYYFEKKLSKEISDMIRDHSSFKIKLDKVRHSTKDKHIFLDVTTGKEIIVRLKEELYKKLGLKWTKNFLYKPHITIANCKTKREQQSALMRIKKQRLDFSCEISSLFLLEFADDLRTIKSKKKFDLEK